MTRSRPQNSILAVATLGVYLGLILAGGAPSILAQAATAKQFNIKDEIVKKDDLDKKPDRHADDSVIGPVADLVQALARKDFFGERPRDYSIDAEFCRDALGRLAKDPKYSDAVAATFRNGVIEIVDGFLSRIPAPASPKCDSTTSSHFHVGVLYFDQAIKVNLEFVPHDDAAAADFAETINAGLRAGVSRWAFLQLVRDNTNVTSDPTRILVVTTLPRGSLDTLLASK